jgi:hypothetical protein
MPYITTLAAMALDNSMKGKLWLVILFISMAACRATNEPSWDRNTGRLTIINNSDHVRANDSIIQIIDVTRFQMPREIKNTTLVIETYRYPHYVKILDSKYSIGQRDWFSRKNYKRHKKFTRAFWSSYKIDQVYADSQSINSLDANKYRFLIKEAARTTVVQDSVRKMNGWHTNRIYYLFDRKDSVMRGEIKDLHEFATQLQN